jgi:pyruvate carboxylase subunit B
MPETSAAGQPVKITDTTLRDAHQSLIATRMTTEDIIDIAAKLDEVGYHSLEVWGGATFDVMIRFLAENPFDRLRKINKASPKTPLQMLLRGQNLVGYRNYPDDVVREFIAHAADAGVDIFRVFDALNDPRNIESSAKAIVDTGKHFQAAVCFSITERRIGGPVFNEKYYAEKVRQFSELGASSICIKDMAGLLTPQDAYNLVAAIKAESDLPVQLHTHMTSGMGSMTYMRAIDAGVDVIDCALASMAGSTSQPAVEPLVVALEGGKRGTGLDLKLLSNINDAIELILPDYERFKDHTHASRSDAGVLIHQIPGGMRSNMVNQLKEAGALDRLPEVIEELPRVRRELGSPPLVTPTSQIIGTQAVMNVLMGRYKMISEEVQDLCYGLYGKTPVEIDPAIQKICLKGYSRGQTPVTGRAADYLEPEMESAAAKISEIYEAAGKKGELDKDHVLIEALYPRKGQEFLEWLLGITDKKPGEAVAPAADPAPGALHSDEVAGDDDFGPGAQKFRVAVDGEVYDVMVEGSGDFVINPNAASSVRVPAASKPKAKVATKPRPAVAAAPRSPAPTQPATPASGGANILVAPMPGTILAYLVSVGDDVIAGQPVVTLEAMKMENKLPAPRDGKVASLGPDKGASVANGDTLIVFE